MSFGKSCVVRTNECVGPFKNYNFLYMNDVSIYSLMNACLGCNIVVWIMKGLMEQMMFDIDLDPLLILMVLARLE